MGQPYWQPRQNREQLAAKRNPNGRRGAKKDNLKVTRKVLMDRILAERFEIWEWTLRAQRMMLQDKDGFYHSKRYACNSVWYAEIIEGYRRKLDKLEKIAAERFPHGSL